MKRKMPKTNGAKKPRKVTRRPSGEYDAMLRDAIRRAELREKSAKERAQFEGQWKLSTLATLLALGLEQDHVPRKINRRKREAGLTEPAPLPVADAVGGQHPGTAGFTLPEFPQSVHDAPVLDRADRWLLARFTSAQSELEARVALAEAAVESFRHDHSKCLEFIHSCTSGTPADFAPSQEVPTELSAYLARHYDPDTGEIVAQGAPLDQDAGVGELLIGIPLVEKSRHPSMESSYTACEVADMLGLVPLGPLKQPPRLSRFVRKCVAQVRRFLDACARRITGFEPPV